MDRILLSTLAYRSPEEVFPYVRSFTDYPRYTDHLKEVRVNGNGDVGSIYDLRLAWWKLSYTARSKVTEIQPPDRIDWELVHDLDAHGHWRVAAEPESAPDEKATASRVFFQVNYDSSSASPDAVELPSFTSLDWVVEKVTPKIKAEAEQVVRRIVYDLEGEPRDVTLTVHEKPGNS